MPSDLSARDRDLMIRTILGEAANQGPRGQAAVAHVILNRTAEGNYGATPSHVVLAPNQFEPWSTKSKELMAIKPTSPAYQQAGDIVDMVAGGEIPDPTNGATHFYSPSSQAALGRAAPSWAKQPTAQIGGHTFFAPNGAVSPDPLDAINKAISDPN
jgi:spore germination cell wall hydrolase CwlJ-like protein